MKKFIGVVFGILFALIFATQSFAQTPTKTPLYPLNTNKDVPQDFHTYTQSVFIEVLSAATCFIGGVDVLNPERRCLGFDQDTKKIGYVESQGGLIAVMGNMIGGTFTIPVSSTHYGQYLVSNFGFTQKSVAAIPAEDGGGSTPKGFGTGIGFNGLNPVVDIWTAFRNLTYLFFVLVFIILGLGIMFRVNIDARTVMTIQNQIPKIIIALVLITLSYAIAGFLIDMMYVSIYLIIHVFDSQGLVTLTNIDTNPVMAVGPFGGLHGIAAPAATGVGGIISSLFEGTIGNILGMIVTGIIGGYLGNSLFSMGGGFVGGIAGGVIGLLFGSKILGLIATVIAYLIIALAILSALFRVWFMLLKSYIYIFLDVIFAPFWIIGGILPGSPGGVGPWLRSIVANLAAFPAVIMLFMIGRTIQERASGQGGNFVPPLIGDPGANSGEAIASLIGLGIILIMPEAVNITKKALKAPEMKYSSSIGRAIGAGSGVITSPIKGTWGKLWGQDAHGHDRYLTRKFGERLGRLGSGLSGGSYDNVVRNKDGDTRSIRKFFGRSRMEKLVGDKWVEDKEAMAKKGSLFSRWRNRGNAAPDDGTHDDGHGGAARPGPTAPHAPAGGAATSPETEGATNAAHAAGAPGPGVARGGNGHAAGTEAAAEGSKEASEKSPEATEGLESKVDELGKKIDDAADDKNSH